jgi:hypothetical protein
MDEPGWTFPASFTRAYSVVVPAFRIQTEVTSNGPSAPSAFSIVVVNLTSSPGRGSWGEKVTFVTDASAPAAVPTRATLETRTNPIAAAILGADQVVIAAPTAGDREDALCGDDSY